MLISEFMQSVFMFIYLNLYLIQHRILKTRPPSPHHHHHSGVMADDVMTKLVPGKKKLNHKAIGLLNPKPRPC